MTVLVKLNFLQISLMSINLNIKGRVSGLCLYQAKSKNQYYTNSELYKCRTHIKKFQTFQFIRIFKLTFKNFLWILINTYYY